MRIFATDFTRRILAQHRKKIFCFLNEKPKSQLKYNIPPDPRKVIRGTQWLITANPKQNILSIFSKVYYIQSIDEQIKRCALTQMSKY